MKMPIIMKAAKALEWIDNPHPNSLGSKKLHKYYCKELDKALEDMSIPRPYDHAMDMLNKSEVMEQIRREAGKPDMKIVDSGNVEGAFKYASPVILKTAGFLGFGKKRKPNDSMSLPITKEEDIFGALKKDLPPHLQDYEVVEQAGDGHGYKVKSNVNGKIYDIDNEEGGNISHPSRWIREAQYKSYKDQHAAYADMDRELGIEPLSYDENEHAYSSPYKYASVRIPVVLMKSINKENT